MGAVDAFGAAGESWIVARGIDRGDFSFDGDFSVHSHGRIAGGGDAGCALAMAEIGGGGLSGSKNSGDGAGAGAQRDGDDAGGGLAGISWGEERWGAAGSFDQ